ncbi:MAG: UDP-N-acetylmuramoyl-tripeptide--D-alanyl-D-alanine ligase [Capnocytophaga sp.]|nr:UDP-N-acetylmuramoyl-tripeptide--D-alanyl-D-alanine ligase [Capnocytophaga sp.]
MISTKQLYDIFCKSQKISTDSRNIIPDSIFFALKGEHFDGNQFAKQALEDGASFAVVDNPDIVTSEHYLLVEDTLTALQQLANYHRRQLQTLIVAITGSNGKTTTKELMRAVLSQTFRVTATQGNLNNHIGVPLTLLSIRPETDIAIVEMGANHPNEIAALCNIAEPDYGYITNFGKAHLEGFGSIEGVIKAKSELYEYLIAHQKTVFVNSDDAIQIRLLKDYTSVYTFGQSTEVNLNMQLKENNPIAVEVNGTEIKSNLVGKYNFPNIASAIALGRFFTISYEAISRGIGSYIPNNNRSQFITIDTNTILMDAYNANPSSMAAAIENMAALNNPNKILILGDMFELGISSTEEHQMIVEKIALHPWQNVFLIGENFAKTTCHFPQFENFDAFADYFKRHIPSSALILIKGSRGMALERVLDILK